MTGPVAYFGIRFKPLGHQGIISTPMGAWNNADHVINAAELLPENLTDVLLNACYKTLGFKQRCQDFSTILLNALQDYTLDARLVRYIQYCGQQASNNIDLSDSQCAAFGISARQLRRLTKQHLGLSPKHFSDVMRFQRTLKMMTGNNSASAWTVSYYDQPHFIRHFKNMSGVTPSEFHQMSFLYNTA